MEWEHLSPKTLAIMKELGDFSPTVNVKKQTVKGYMDGKTYFHADDLREMAYAFLDVAKWLEDRAAQEPSAYQQGIAARGTAGVSDNPYVGLTIRQPQADEWHRGLTYGK